MIATILLALVASTGKPKVSPCVPASVSSAVSAIQEHRTLRGEIGEPMPQSPTMVMLYGEGGHLENNQYSIVVALADDGTWRGTAVGRSQIWIKEAPYRSMKRVEWTLDEAAGRQLTKAIVRRCPVARTPTYRSGQPVPTMGTNLERIDVLTPDRAARTFYSEEGAGSIAALIRTPLVAP